MEFYMDNRIKRFCLSVKQKSWTASVKAESYWSIQEACFACVTQVSLAVNHNTSVTSGEWIRCLKRIAQAYVNMADVHQISWGYEQLKESKDSLKASVKM